MSLAPIIRIEAENCEAVLFHFLSKFAELDVGAEVSVYVEPRDCIGAVKEAAERTGAATVIIEESDGEVFVRVRKTSKWPEIKPSDLKC